MASDPRSLGGHTPCLASSSQLPRGKPNCSPKHITLCLDVQGRSPAKARHCRQGAAVTDYLVVASASGFIPVKWHKQSNQH